MPRPFIQDIRDAVRDSDIPATDKGVLRTMETYANSEGKGVRASVQTIATGSGISRRTAVYAVKRAIEAGWLRRVESGKAPRTPSEYELRIGAPYKIDRGDRSASIDAPDSSNRCTKRILKGAHETPETSSLELVNELVKTVDHGSTSKYNVDSDASRDAKDLVSSDAVTPDPSEVGSGAHYGPHSDCNQLQLILGDTLARQYASLDSPIPESEAGRLVLDEPICGFCTKPESRCSCEGGRRMCPICGSSNVYGKAGKEPADCNDCDRAAWPRPGHQCPECGSSKFYGDDSFASCFDCGHYEAPVDRRKDNAVR